MDVNVKILLFLLFSIFINIKSQQIVIQKKETSRIFFDKPNVGLLRNLSVDCGTGSYLMGYNFKIINNSNRYEAYYEYTCGVAPYDTGVSNYSTQLNIFFCDDGCLLYWDRHKIECPTGFLNKFKLDQLGSNIRWDYTCLNQPPNTLTNNCQSLKSPNGISQDIPCTNCNTFYLKFLPNLYCGDLSNNIYQKNFILQSFNYKFLSEGGSSYYDLKMCHLCHLSCLTCSVSDIKLCYSCNTGYYYLEDKTFPSQCYNLPPSGYYNSGTVFYFSKCYSLCEKCMRAGSDQDNNCSTCIANYAIISSSSNCAPISTPPGGYYYDSVQNKHLPCYKTCSSCSSTGNISTHNCLNCQNSYFKKDVDTNSNCYNTAPEANYYLNDNYNPSIWIVCYKTCASCTKAGNLQYNNCNTCNNGYFHIEGISSNFNCFSTNTGLNLYLNTSNAVNVWSLCHTNCGTCNQAGSDLSNNCNTCKNSFYPKEGAVSNFDCYSSSPGADYFLNKNEPQFIWSLCYQTCGTCLENGTSSNNLCTSCKANYYSIEGEESNPNFNCYGSIPSPGNYYLNTTLRPNRWSLCFVNCKTCIKPGTISKNNCDSCITDFYSKELQNSEFDCYNSIPSPGNYFLNSAFSPKKWSLCYDSCASCTRGIVTTSHGCLKCKTGYYKLEDEQQSCYQPPCPDSYLYDSTSSVCIRCDISCKTCERSAKNCKLCNIPNSYYPLVNNSNLCFYDCPLSYWKDNINMICNNCHISCSKCSNGSDTCIECARDYIQIQNNKCIKNCYSGSIYDFNQKACIPCSSPCATCLSNVQTCITCLNDYYLIENLNKCVNSCPTGYYLDKLNKLCKKCVNPCKSCSNSTICLSCQNSFVLIEESGLCISKCPTGFYLNELNNICFKCDLDCWSCISASDKCLTCKENLLYVPDLFKCLGSCSMGYFQTNSPDNGAAICDQCSSKCLTCKDKSEKCTSCQNTSYLLENSNECYAICPQRFYGDSSSMKCLPCYEKCFTCKGPGKMDCVSCSGKYNKIKNGECTDKCTDDEIDIIKECISIRGCIDLISIDAPSQYMIEKEEFSVNIKYTIKNECITYKPIFEPLITFKWENNYNGTLFNSNSLLKLPTENLLNGYLEFKASLIYNDITIGEVSKLTYFKKNKLIINVKNENNLRFLNGFQILIDASLSFDEGFIDVSGKTEDKNLKFLWTCPEIINANFTNLNSSILKLNKEDYLNLSNLLADQKVYNGTINLSIFKDRRINTKTINFGLLNMNTTSANSSSLNVNDYFNNLFVISPRNRATKNQDLILEIEILDKNISIYDYDYYWTVDQFTSESSYLNGRFENNLRLKNEDLKTGDNIIRLQIKGKRIETEIVKSYIYKKSQNPYGGNCIANPNRGVSLKSNFTFTADMWQSANLPLSYKFYMRSSIGKEISLSEDFIFQNFLQTWTLPVGSIFYVDVMDSFGLITTSSCTLTVEKNKSKLDLKKLISSTTSLKEKLLLTEAYLSNDNKLDESIADTSLNYLESILTTSSDSSLKKKSIQSNLDIMISQMNIITSNKSILENNSIREKSDNILINIIDNMDNIIQNHDKVSEVFDIINNRLPDPINLNSSNPSLEENRKIISNVDKLVESLQKQIYSNLVEGQSLVFSNNNFISQIAKISHENINQFEIIKDEDDSIKTKVRVLQYMPPNSDNCSLSAIMCLDKDTIKNLTNNKHIGIVSKYNKNSNLAIEQSTFSLDSLKFSFYDENQLIKRVLSSSSLASSYSSESHPLNVFKFNIRLKGPNLNETASDILNKTSCLIYDENNKPDADACTTWYDYKMYEIICICSKQGLTVNVLDRKLSEINRSNQFPKKELSYCKFNINIFS